MGFNSDGSTGLWCDGTRSSCTPSLLWYNLIIVVMLLVIAGVETNPGPQQGG
ncbi:hypothetical protein L9F63_024287, partial [Diploptera punctata]